MDLEEIKHDFDGDAELQCCMCLSIGRNLSPLGDLYNIYIKITTGIPNLYPEIVCSTEVCWECKNLLRKVLKFQEQVVKAKELLKIGQNYVYGPLSNLTTVTLSDTKNTVYLNENCNKSRITKLEEINQVRNGDQPIPKDILETNNTSELHNKLGNYHYRTNCLTQTKEKNQNRNDGHSEITDHNVEIYNSPILQNESKSTELSDSENIFESDLYDKDLTETYCQEKNLCEKELKKSNCSKKRFKQKKPKFKLCSINFDELFHIGTHHNKDVECKICEKSIEIANVKKHFKNVHKHAIQCLSCGLKFGNRRTFFAHYKEWHEKYICDHCGVSFKMRYSIEKHISKQHSPLKCCNKSFKTYSGYWRHNKLQHTTQPHSYCVECDKRYKDVYRYKWHLCNSVKHAGTKKKTLVPCTKCDKVFTKKTNMTEHYDLVHLKIYRHRCEICDKNYVRNADLVKHKRRNHEGILPPKDKICNICGRAFTTNTILKNHQRTHNRERGMINKTI